MEEDKYQELLQTLNFFVDNPIPAEIINEQINTNYTDLDNNNYFHYLSNYSFKDYCIFKGFSSENEIITKEKYKSLLKQYLDRIHSFIEILISSDCDLTSENMFEQIPLDICLIKQNYYMAKEYVKYQFLFSSFFNKNGLNILFLNNCLEEECIEFILNLFKILKETENVHHILRNYLIRKIDPNSYITPLTALFRNYNKYIYTKFNKLLKINAIEFLQKGENGEYFIPNDEETKNNIKAKTILELNNFCTNCFYNLYETFIECGAAINYIELYSEKLDISSFMYLMAYPKIPDLLTFIIKNKINVNYQDYLGRTPLIHLINNKENINKISSETYYEVFDVLNKYYLSDLSKKDINGISAFLLCLINNYYSDAKDIYNSHIDKSLLDFNLDILLFLILKMVKNEFNESFISTIMNTFNDEINLNNIDEINNRTILHYFFMFYSNSYDNYLKTFNFILNLIEDYNKTDIFQRHSLFYFFIDYCGDVKKTEDPYKILEYCLNSKHFKIDLNENDIFGNNLLFYAVKSGHKESIKLLIKYGAKLNNNINNEGNSIYSTALMVDEQIFLDLYDLQKDKTILEHKVYEMFNNYDYFTKLKNKKKEDLNNNKNNNIMNLNMYHFFNEPDIILCEGFNNINNNNIKYEKNNNIIENDAQSMIIEKDNFSEVYQNLLNEKNINIINNYINDNLNFKFEFPLKKMSIKINDRNIIDIIDILQRPDIFLNEIKFQEKSIISVNFYSYCLKFRKNIVLTKLFDIKKSNKISLCIDFLEINNYDKLISTLNQMIDEYKDNNEQLLNIKNEEERNIIYILAMTVLENNETLNKLYDILSKFKIDDMYDIYGNTPMYYACNKLNKKFIEIFSNLKFLDINKNTININSSLFIKSKSNTTPLEQLYKNICLEDNQLLTLIIDITLKEKKGYILYLLIYLIDNYKSSFKSYLYETYSNNLKDSNYLIRIIGLYQYLTECLNCNFEVEDDNGNNPLMLCILKRNLDVLFDLLVHEKEYILSISDKTNKEGKTLIHLIIESNFMNKKEILLQMLKLGFKFDIKDNKGYSPIDYANFNNENEIINILKKKYSTEGIPFKLNSVLNFYRDSDLLYKESILDSSRYQQCDNLYNLVSDKFTKYSNDKNYKVCIDSDSVPYNVVLLKGNILYYHDDIVKKLYMQIIEDIKNNVFIVASFENKLFNEYIAVNFEDAENKFKELFKLKTDNNWDDVKKDKTKFKTNYIKYYCFGYDFNIENDIYDYLKITINQLYIKKTKIKYNDNYKIRDFIYYLARTAYNNRFNNNNNNNNNDANENKNNSLNNLIENNTRNIIKNYKLRALNEAMIKLGLLENIYNQNLDDIDERKKNYLINSYLKLIPYSIYNMDSNNLDSKIKIIEEKGRISTYYYIENILKIFLGAIKNLDEIHPLDYIINSLGCRIYELVEETEEKRCIIDFLKKTGANSIKNIFKIADSINDINFNPNNFKKRYIFCHGTKVENILGILSEGLKKSPVQASFTGNSYGEGIYLSDSFNVSSFYSKKSNINSDKEYMLLVEAALGEIKTDYNSFNLSINYDNAFITDEGYGIFKIPNYVYNSKGVIVIKDEMNVRVKYIVEI